MFPGPALFETDDKCQKRRNHEQGKDGGEGKAAEKYLQIAYEEVWKVFKDKAPESYAKLRPLLYVEGKPNLLPVR